MSQNNEKKSETEAVEKETLEEANEATPAEDEKRKGLFARLFAKLKKIKENISAALSERGEEIKHAKAKRIWAIVVVLLLVTAFCAFYLTLGVKIVQFSKDEENFREWKDGLGVWAIVIFVAIRSVQTLAKVVPGSAMEIMSGVIFQTWWEGVFWCSVGTLIGTVIVLFLGKKFGAKLVGLFVSPDKVRELTQIGDTRRRNFIVFLIYFLPYAPKDAFTWVASLADEGKVKFVIATTIIRLPSTIVLTWCGNQFVEGSKVVSLIVFAAFMVVAILSGYVYKAISKKRKAEIEEEKAKEEITGETSEK